MKISRKELCYLGIITYFSLLVLSLYYYKERTIFTDIAFHLYYLLKDGDYAIQNFRFVSFFTQSFPLLGQKLDLDLKLVMQLYSAGFIVFYAAAFFLLNNLLRLKNYALCMLLFSTLMVTHTFYWMQSELPQGLSLMILYFGLIDYENKNNKIRDKSMWFVPIKAVVLFILFFSHPLIIFPFLFAVAFFAIKEKPRESKYVREGLTFLTLYLLKAKFFKTAYDSQSVEGLSNFKSYFPNYIDLVSNQKFMEYLISDYYLFLLGFVVAITYYIIKSRRIKLLILSSSLFGYLLLVNVSYPEGAEQFYIENLYLPLSLFVIIPLVFDVLPNFKGRFVLPFLVTFMMLRVGHIAMEGKDYTQRLDYLAQILDETGSLNSTKLIIPQCIEHKKSLWMTWATSYEFWLQSTLNSGESRSLIITENPDDYSWTLPANTKFITPWDTPEYETLPNRYFNFRDSTPYHIVK